MSIQPQSVSEYFKPIKHLNEDKIIKKELSEYKIALKQNTKEEPKNGTAGSSELEGIIDFIFTDMTRKSNTPVYSTLRKNLEQEIDKQLLEARIDELKVFVNQLNNNHHDMPIGTASAYVNTQMVERLNELWATKNPYPYNKGG